MKNGINNFKIKIMEIRLNESNGRWQYSLWERAPGKTVFKYKFIGSDEKWYDSPRTALKNALDHLKELNEENH